VLDLLWEEAGPPEQALPEALRSFYGGPFGLPEQVLYANFVETLDGIVALPSVEKSNALVADGNEDDKFLMGLLRAAADCILIGAGTMLASPKGLWRPSGVYPKAADAFAELGEPAVAVVSTGASLDPNHPVLQRAVLLTTARGAEQFAGTLPDVVAVNDGDWVDLRAAVAVLRERGHRRILSEAGPTVFGSLLADGLVDELFLTVSPVIAGRTAAGSTLGLVEGVALLPQARIGGRLASVRRSEDHLFLRYVFDVSH
jgi:riboflavin biosynthesis pyrimidine reductase